MEYNLQTIFQNKTLQFLLAGISGWLIGLGTFLTVFWFWGVYPSDININRYDISYTREIFAQTFSFVMLWMFLLMLGFLYFREKQETKVFFGAVIVGILLPLTLLIFAILQ